MATAGANQMLFHWLSISHPSGAVLFGLIALAQWPLYVLPVGMAALWFCGTRVDREAAVAAALTGALALLAAHVVSTLIDQPRPFMVGLAPNLLDHPADSSFPSDHATLFFALGAAFAARPISRLRWLGGALSLIGLGVGWARVALGVHFPLDILGAAIVGVIAALLVRLPLSRRPVAKLNALSEAIRRWLPLPPEQDGDRNSAFAGDDAHPAH